MSELRAMNRRILVDRTKLDKIGSIIIPETAKSRYNPTRGVLRNCANDCEVSTQDCVGKEILFARYAGDWVECNGEDYFICEESDILAVVEEEAV